MTPRLERILQVAAWVNLVGTLIVVSLMGLARDAQAADGDAGGAGALVAMNLWHFAINMVYAAAAIAVLFAVLRLRDRLLEVKFRDKVVPLIHRSSIAAAIYYGVWVLAGALIVARAFA